MPSLRQPYLNFFNPMYFTIFCWLDTQGLDIFLTLIKIVLLVLCRVFIRHPRSENSAATTGTQNFGAKLACFLRELCPTIIIFLFNTLQYSPVTPILIENPAHIMIYTEIKINIFTSCKTYILEITKELRPN